MTQEAIEAADLLFVVDDSASMAAHQRALARGIDAVLRGLPMTSLVPAPPAPAFQHVKSLHVGVVSSDLGTPGSVVPTCAASDVGDDGLLNPIRGGLALRAHPPWMSAPPGDRPARCTNDPAQYPSFLTFDAGTSPTRPLTNASEFRDDFACNAYLSTGGCDLEQPLESAYRALVVRDARGSRGSRDPNAGFVRDNAALAIVVVTDEEDGSVRDCRFREEGQLCVDATSVFDARSTRWSSSDLNLRFYLYAPGSAQDPTWPLDRYIDPVRPNRGFTSLKPDRPDLVIFAAIAGVPLALPTRGAEVDYDALLGLNADGSDGYTAMEPDGPVSMRQANLDPGCTSRVVPACRAPGSASTRCDADTANTAAPSRRIVEVVRRFEQVYRNGVLASVCASDYEAALTRVMARVESRLSGRCLRRPLATEPSRCADGAAGCRRTTCRVRELLPTGVTSEVCTAARGRSVGARDSVASVSRETCLVDQVIVGADGALPAGREGFYYDTRRDSGPPWCDARIVFTGNAALLPGATAVIECDDPTSTTPAGACG